MSNYKNTSRGRGPITKCDSKFRNCNNYNKSLPGSSGNLVLTGMTQSQNLTTLVNIQQYSRGARWVIKYAPINEYGSREGAPHGYGQSPKNYFN
jgi:hypothetical protein